MMKSKQEEQKIDTSHLKILKIIKEQEEILKKLFATCISFEELSFFLAEGLVNFQCGLAIQGKKNVTEKLFAEEKNELLSIASLLQNATNSEESTDNHLVQVSEMGRGHILRRSVDGSRERKIKLGVLIASSRLFYLYTIYYNLRKIADQHAQLANILKIQKIVNYWFRNGNISAIQKIINYFFENENIKTNLQFYPEDLIGLINAFTSSSEKINADIPNLKIVNNDNFFENTQTLYKRWNAYKENSSFNPDAMHEGLFKEQAFQISKGQTQQQDETSSKEKQDTLDETSALTLSS